MRHVCALISTVLLITLLVSTLLPCLVMAEEKPDHITVAQPATNVLGGLVAVKTVSTADEYSTLLSASVKPAAAILTITNDLSVVADDGARLTDFDGFLSDTNYDVIPVLRIEDTDTADAVANHLTEIDFFDVILLSTDTFILSDLRLRLPSAIGAVDFTFDLKDKTALTDEECLAIRKTVWENRASIAYLPSSLCDVETIEFLYHHQVTVWLDADGLNPYDAIFSGAVVLVSDDTDTLLDIACNSLPKRSMTRRPLLIGHRGNKDAPENTIEGARYAFANGADSVELDVMLTQDGEMVVIHDDWTERTCNRNLSVTGSTLAELKELYVNVGFENHKEFSHCRIPTFEEFLDAFKGTDHQLTVEIKTTDPAAVPKICAAIRDRNMVGQCNIISFFIPQLELVSALAPEIPIGYLTNDVIVDGNREGSLSQLRRTLGGINATYNPGSAFDSVKAFLLNCRGLSTHIWTVSSISATEFGKPVANGVASITADHTAILADKPITATLSTAFPDVMNVGDTFTPDLRMLGFFGDEIREVYALACVVNGEDDAITASGNCITFSKPGTYTFTLSVTARLGFMSYQVPVPHPITVTVVGDAPCDTEGTTEAILDVTYGVLVDHDANHTIVIVSLMSAVALCGAIALFVAKKKKN